MTERNITSRELVEFMQQLGLSWYGLATTFAFTNQTAYRWKRLIGLDPDATLSSQFMCARVIKLELKFLREYDKQHLDERGRSYFETLKDLPAPDRPAVIRSLLDNTLYQ